MINQLRRAVPLVGAFVVLMLGLLGSSCTVSTTTGGQTVPPTETATATPTFAISFNGKTFQCSQGACPADITWDGSTTITSTAHAAVLGIGVVTDNPNYTDTVSLSTIKGDFEQNPRNPGKVTIAKGSVFFVHTSGQPTAATPPELSAGYYSAVQVVSMGANPSGAPTLLLYFVTFSADGKQKAGGAAAIMAPPQSAHVTVNMTIGGGLSLLDGSNGTTGATPTATNKP
jgi:hypothetical protein